MKKKLLIALLVVCLVLTMLPMAFAAGTTRSVNTAEKLMAALDAAQAGDTIKLTADITLDETLVINKAITVNGQDFKLTSSASTAVEVATEGKVTVRDMKIVGATGEEPMCGVLISEKAEVALTDLQIREVQKLAVYVLANEAKVTISGGRLASTAALWVEGDKTSVTVKNVEITGDNTVTGESNSCATIVVYGKETAITVTGGSLTADQETGAYQYLVASAGDCEDCTVSLNTELKLRNGAGYYIFDSEDPLAVDGVTLSVRDDYQAALAKKGIATAKGATGMVTVKGEGVVKDANGNLYVSLAEAFAAGGEIVLTQDLELTEAAIVPANKTVTLDLAGYSISPAANWDSEHNALIIVGRKGNLTVKDSSEEETGLIDGTGNSKVYAALQVTYKGETGTGDAVLTIQSGTVQGTYYGITGNGNRDGSKITVNGGKIEGLASDGAGIFHPHKGTVTVNGGEIEGASGIEMRAGTLIVNGGTITANGSFSESANGSGNTVLGAAVVLSQHTTEKAISLTVNGGKLVGDYAVYEKDLQEDPSKNITIKLTKGEFEGDVYSENCTGIITGGTYDYEPAEGLVAKNLTAVETVEGKWVIGEANAAKVGSTKYATVQEAIDAAMKKKGGTVTLLRDVIVEEPVIIDGVYASEKATEKTYGNITLDLAGFALAADSTSFDGDSVICVGRQCGLTVKDSSKEETGSITYNGNEDAMVAIKLTFNGDAGSGTATLTVQGGTITGYEIGISGNGMRDRTKITVDGGKIMAAAEQTGVGIYHPQNGTVSINAGEIEAATGIEMRAGTLTVNGGTITATGTPASDSPNGSGSTVVGAAVALSQHSTEKRISLTVNGGTLTGAAAVYEVDTVNGETNVSIYLKDALYSGVIYSENCTGFVYDGLYSEDMSDYCANGKTAVANTVSTTSAKYPFKVGALGANPAEVEHGDASVNVPDNATGDVLDASEYLADNAEDISVEGAGLDAAAANVANNNKYTTADGAEALGDDVSPADVTIVIETYMDVSVVDVAEDGTVTLDIVPLYRTLADNGSETAVLDEGKALKITGPVTVKVPVDLPGGEDYFVKHTHGNKTYIYKATVSGGILTFVNPNGFSTFTVLVDAEIVAKIGDVGYATLADAVRAVRDGETIVLQKDIQGSVVVKRTVEFYLDRNDCTFTGAIKAGDNCKNKSEEADHYIFEYSGGSGGGNDDTFTEDGNADDEEVNAEGDNYGGGSGGGGGDDFGWDNPFTDVDEDDWFYAAVEYVVEIGMMNGTNDGTTFSPELKMTRGMLMTMLARLDGVDTSGGETWYSVGVEWAVANGIAEEGDPNVNITREEIASMLWKYAGKSYAQVNVLVNHPDGDQVSDWAREAMNWSVYAGLFEGDENGALNPQGEATRMEVATLIMRFCKIILGM